MARGSLSFSPASLFRRDATPRDTTTTTTASPPPSSLFRACLPDAISRSSRQRDAIKRAPANVCLLSRAPLQKKERKKKNEDASASRSRPIRKPPLPPPPTRLLFYLNRLYSFTVAARLLGSGRLALYRPINLCLRMGELINQPEGFLLHFTIPILPPPPPPFPNPSVCLLAS